MPLTRRNISLLAALLMAAVSCAPRIGPASARLPAPPPRIAVPEPASNLVVNGGFERLEGEDPAGWQISGRNRPGARLRVVETPDAPEGRRVAEISLASAKTLDYGLYFLQDVRIEPRTTYDLSVWVRGIDLVSGVNAPIGFGQHCGLFFWMLGPDADPFYRILPGGAFPRRDGTSDWEERRMRFTTPGGDVFPPPKKGTPADPRFHLSLQVLLFGTGTIQVDDVRLARSKVGPPPPRRGSGRLALARAEGKPFFAIGLHLLPDGLDWKDVAREKIFNFNTGGGNIQEKRRLGMQTMVIPWGADPACRGCGSKTAKDCAFCTLCPNDNGRCGAYNPVYVAGPGVLGACFDEPNAFPEYQGGLEEIIASVRRMKKNAARARPPDQPFLTLATDMPGAVYYNSYGWDDLARYHASEAFDIIGVVRRGGNPKKGAVGSVMSEYPQTSINGIRNETRRLSDDVTDGSGKQGKPVWLLVNGGSGRIVTDRDDAGYERAPHTPAELLASRPSLPQLRYMLYAAILNGATGLDFYQDDSDTHLTGDDPFWKTVLLPAAAELAILERETGFLTEAAVNPIPYRLDGKSEMVDSMLKRSGDGWILIVANASPDPASGLRFVLEEKTRFEGRVERLEYRHDSRPSERHFGSVPAGIVGPDRFGFDLPGYGVGIYRFRLSPGGDGSGRRGGS